MRQTISGLVAAFALMAASSAPALACGGGYGGCSPCDYVSPCGATYERLPDPYVQYHTAVPAPQYYYVDQGPTYTGPGDFAPRRVYREEGISGWSGYHHRRHYYGYEGRGYPHRHWHHYAAPYRYGYHYRPHVLHSYY